MSNLKRKFDVSDRASSRGDPGSRELREEEAAAAAFIENCTSARRDHQRGNSGWHPRLLPGANSMHAGMRHTPCCHLSKTLLEEFSC